MIYYISLISIIFLTKTTRTIDDNKLIGVLNQQDDNYEEFEAIQNVNVPKDTQIFKYKTQFVPKDHHLESIARLLDDVLLKIDDSPANLTDVEEFKFDNDKWSEWSKWSRCSVSCGRGRQIRWRHCKSADCEIESELQEKMCQLPECSPYGLLK